MNYKILIHNSLILFLLGCQLCPSHLSAQTDSSYVDFGDFGGLIYLDSVMVTATREGLEIDDFIRYVRNDTSFYKAFQNVRTQSYSADNEIHFYSKKNKEKASYTCQSIQVSDGRCGEMKQVDVKVTGNYFKRKKKLRYYTAKMYHKLFLIENPFCYDPSQITPNASGKGMEKHIAELKKLIFTPGEKADVPLIGKKTEIFNPQMAKYYDFHFSGGKYLEQYDCYIFSATVKPEFQKRKAKKTVIKSLSTYFDRSTLQVLGRSYHLAYYGAAYSFDVTMNIELTKKGNVYLPRFLSYEGFWDIAFKKPEISRFQARFHYD